MAYRFACPLARYVLTNMASIGYIFYLRSLHEKFDGNASVPG